METKILTFEGHSDDTFGYYVGDHECSGDDYDNCSESEPIVFKLSLEQDSILVYGRYAPLNNSCWIIGLSPVDEYTPIPSWPVQYKSTERGYSPSMTIEVPIDTKVTLFSNRGEGVMTKEERIKRMKIPEGMPLKDVLEGYRDHYKVRGQEAVERFNSYDDYKRVHPHVYEELRTAKINEMFIDQLLRNYKRGESDEDILKFAKSQQDDISWGLNHYRRRIIKGLEKRRYLEAIYLMESLQWYWNERSFLHVILGAREETAS